MPIKHPKPKAAVKRPPMNCLSAVDLAAESATVPPATMFLAFLLEFKPDTWKRRVIPLFEMASPVKLKLLD